MVSDDQTDLGGIELLSGLDPETLRNLEKRCRWYRFAANQIILDRGDHAKHDIYFVIKGAVRIVNYAASGREIAFANVREGNYFGELAAITDNPRSASVVAVTECRLASLAPSFVCDGYQASHPRTVPAVRVGAATGCGARCSAGLA